MQISEAEEHQVFSTAASYLKYKGLDLVKSAVCLTIQGDLEEDYTANPAQHHEENEEEISVRVLATFEYQDVEYIISEPVDPVLMFATASALAEEVGVRGGGGVQSDGAHIQASAPVDVRPKVYCQLLKGPQIHAVLLQVEKQLGRRFTQQYAGFGSSL